MARKRRRNEWRAGELNLTAMIDVAFQLLSFFVITSHPIDVYSKFSVLRPTAERSAATANYGDMLRVMVLPDRFAVNDLVMSYNDLEVRLTRMAAVDKKQMMLIQCINQAPHKQLIKLLDLCAKLGMTNLSVVSSGGA